MTENRNGFVVEAELRPVSGTVEREAAKAMIVRHSPGAQRLTVGADKGFDTADFVADMRAFNVTPHVAQNTTGRRSTIRTLPCMWIVLCKLENILWLHRRHKHVSDREYIGERYDPNTNLIKHR